MLNFDVPETKKLIMVILSHRLIILTSSLSRSQAFARTFACGMYLLRHFPSVSAAYDVRAYNHRHCTHEPERKYLEYRLQ